MERLNNIHPGEILDEEFLNPLGITPYRLAKDIKVQQTRIREIVMGGEGNNGGYGDTSWSILQRDAAIPAQSAGDV